MRFLIENELKRMQNFNRKRKKGQSPFVTYNAGDVEKGMVTFNKNMGAAETSASQSSGEGLGESLSDTWYAIVVKDKVGNTIAAFGKDKETLMSKRRDLIYLSRISMLDSSELDVEEFNDLVQSFWNLEIDLASDNSSLHDNIIVDQTQTTLKIKETVNVNAIITATIV